MAKRNSTKTTEIKIGQDGAMLTADKQKLLQGYVSEIERHDAEKAVIQADIGLIYNAVKDAGFDTRAVRENVKRRKKTRQQRDAFDAIVDVYAHALGDLADLPLGKAATDSALKSSGFPIGSGGTGGIPSSNVGH